MLFNVFNKYVSTSVQSVIVLMDLSVLYVSLIEYLYLIVYVVPDIMKQELNVHYVIIHV